MDASFFALVGLILFFALIAYMKVPGKITAALDSRAERIRRELDEARRLREEAQAVLAEYQRKRKEAEAEAETILSTAKLEAERMTTDARQALDEMIARRTATAETKIAQAEAQAVAEVRARAAEVAVAAARVILQDKVTGDVASRLLDDGIIAVKTRLN
jgi:F-type H+-transporting ATPase subunit b